MSNDEKKVVAINCLHNFGSSLSSLFMNVYLYIYTNSLVLMSIYTIIRIGLFPPFFIIGSRLSKKHKFSLTYGVGLVFVTLSLVYAISGGSLFERNSYFVLFAALLTGIGEGLYYFSANTCNIVVSTVESRPTFLSNSGFFSNISTFLAPFVATYIINHSLTDLKGYRIILCLIVFIYIIETIVASTLNVRSKDHNSSVRKALSIKNDQQWSDHQKAVFCYGLQESLTLTVTGLLVYNAAGNGGTYAKLQSLFAVLGIVCYRLLAKSLKKEKISRTFAIGICLTISAILVLVYFPNMFGAIYFGIANALQGVFYANSYNFLSANIIDEYQEEMTVRVVARETALSLARCSGMSLIVLCSIIFPEQIYLKVAVSILSIFPLLVYLLLNKYKERL